MWSDRQMVHGRQEALCMARWSQKSVLCRKSRSDAGPYERVVAKLSANTLVRFSTLICLFLSFPSRILEF